MFDSVTLSEIPSTAQAVAGYVGGHFPTWSNVVADFPHAKHLSIAVNAEEDADCLDVENGDAVPNEAPAWFKRQVARGVQRPCFYADASTMPSVMAALLSAGIKRPQYRAWVAHYTHVEHLEPGADATQWTDKALGRNLDQSLCSAAFFADPPAPKPVVNTVHYEWFSQGPFLWGTLHLDEQAIVRAYDKYRAQQTATKHPNRAQLYILRIKLRFLANRVAHVAITNPGKNGKPSWNVDHRGWRYQQLIHRAQGQRFV
jgi:hypothetical protein